MARVKKAGGEEDSFYDAFLSSSEEAPGEPAAAPVATTATPGQGTPRRSRRTPAAPGPTEKAEVTRIDKPAAELPGQTPGGLADPRARTTADEGSATDGPKTTSGGRGVGRRSDPDYMQASSYMLRRMRRQVDRALLNDPSERDYSELIEELVREWLERQGMSA